MELFEYASGARMHCGIYVPGQSLNSIISTTFLQKLYIFLKNSQKSYTEMYIALYNNRVWRLRLVNIGCVNPTTMGILGLSGPVARSCGLMYDERYNRNISYGIYNMISMVQYISTTGDSYARFLIRIRELFESTRIIFVSLGFLHDNNFSLENLQKLS